MKTFYLWIGDFAYHVELYPNAVAMRSAIAEARGKRLKSDDDLQAMCLRFEHHAKDPTGRFRRTKLLGRILFVDKPEPFVVHHELTHAVLGWAKRIKLNPVSTRGEERFACAIHETIDAFWDLYEGAERKLDISKSATA